MLFLRIAPAYLQASTEKAYRYCSSVLFVATLPGHGNSGTHGHSGTRESPSNQEITKGPSNKTYGHITYKQTHEHITCKQTNYNNP